MATSSFFQNVVVKDEAKADEVKTALKGDEHTYSEIPPAVIDYERQKEEARIWCSRLKK